MGVDSLYRVGDGCCSVFKCIPHNNGSSITEKNNREACKETSLRCDVPQHTLTPYGAAANIVICFKTVSQWT